MKIRNMICSTIVLLVACSSLLVAAPVRIVARNSVSQPQQPQAAVDGQGTIYVTFGAGNSVYCATSTDKGKTFADPVLLGKARKLSLGLRRGPRISAGADTVVVTAIDSGALMAWRSTDSGKSWQGPSQVNDALPHAREGLHAMATGPEGEIYCVWLDDRSGGMRIFGAGSTDGGKNWSKNSQIYRSPDGRVCPCCHPAVTYDSNGGLYVMWRNELNGFRDLYGRFSKDGGKTFGQARKIGTGRWKINFCPMDGGYLAAMAPGKVTTVWQRNKQIYRTDSGSSQEKSLGQGVQPWIAATTDGVYITWISSKNGNLWLSAPSSRQPLKLAGGATDPVVAAPISGKGPIVVVWETGQQQGTSIMAAIVGK